MQRAAATYGAGAVMRPHGESSEVEMDRVPDHPGRDRAPAGPCCGARL